MTGPESMYISGTRVTDDGVLNLDLRMATALDQPWTKSSLYTPTCSA